MGKNLESYKKLIGQKIQKRRVEKGFSSQGALATKLGTDQSQVSRWESGKNIPEGQLRAALAELLQVEDDFFELIELNISERAELVLDVQASLASLDERQLRLVLRFVDDLVGHSDASPSRSTDVG